MSTVSAIHVQGIEKSFKEVHVLRGVDFDVEAGSIFALHPDRRGEGRGAHDRRRFSRSSKAWTRRARSLSIQRLPP